MKSMRFALSVAVGVIFALLSTGSAWAESDNGPEAAVKAFNEAITARDVDTAVAQLAGGGVQFTLRALHEGVNPDKMVAPIADHWSTIIPVVLATTSNYRRDVKILSAEAHGDVATVWTKINTLSVRNDIDETSKNEFTEIYLLVDTPDGWKIASIADNRQATKLAATAE